jgi:hypothetical protein
MGLILGAFLLFLGPGLICLLWPKVYLDQVVRLGERIWGRKLLYLRSQLFTRGYILSLRVGGAAGIVMGVLVLWLWAVGYRIEWP